MTMSRLRLETSKSFATTAVSTVLGRSVALPSSAAMATLTSVMSSEELSISREEKFSNAQL